MSSVWELVGKLYPLNAVQQKMVILGLDAAGKTTLFYKITAGEVVNTLPTFGFNVETVKICSKDKKRLCRLNAWDVGGWDKIRPLWRYYFEGVDGITFVVDSNDRERVEDAGKELATLLREIPNVPVLIVANKQDLPKAMSGEEVSRGLNIQQHTGHDFVVVETSCISGKGLDEVVEWITDPNRLEVYRAKKAEADKKTRDEEKKQDKKTILELWLEVEDEVDDLFLEKFADYTLDTWDHRAHLRIAWIILNRHGRNEGVKRIVEGIRNFIQNSERARKTNFHLTMTYFWCHMVWYAIHATNNPSNDFKTFLVMNPQLSNGGLFLDYYEKDTMLNNLESRQTLVMPDKKPLPSVFPGEAEALGVRMGKAFNAEPGASPESKDDSKDSDAMFLQKFEAGEIMQIDEHQTFLRVIWCYVLEFEKTRVVRHRRGQAVAKIFNSLQRDQDFNFHLTRTHFWILQVHAAVVSDKPLIEEFSLFLEAHKSLCSTGLINEYYSGELICSDQAKTEMVLPDRRQKLPNVMSVNKTA